MPFFHPPKDLAPIHHPALNRGRRVARRAMAGDGAKTQLPHRDGQITRGKSLRVCKQRGPLFFPYSEDSFSMAESTAW